METIYCDCINRLKKERKFLEKKLKIKISLKRESVVIEGEPLDEYEANLVIEAMNLGFSTETACLLTDEEFLFEKINIKDYTRRKNLEVIRARLIGTHGKTKETIEQISGCKIKIKGNTIGIIGPADSMEYALTGITNIIKGTKQTNVYKYLEKINTQKRKRGD